MLDARTIEVSLPEGIEVGEDDLEVLRTTFQTIVSLASQCEDRPGRPCSGMTDAGWEVSWGLTWIARAQRGKEYEEATGSTREEAMTRLREATCLHEADGCP